MRATLVLLFVLAVGARGWSDAPEGNFRHLSIEQGLSDGHLRTIVQDPRGFLWFGTIDGLNRYDGYEIRIFRHDPENPRSLGANFVRALHVDRGGRLWVATIGGGLNLFDPRTEDFVRYEHDPADPQSLGSNEVRSLWEGRAGELWIATSNGLDRMDPSGRFRHYRHDPNDPNSLSHDDVYSVLEDRRGSLWVATYGGGLDRLNPAAGREEFVHYRHDPKDPESLASDLIHVLHEDRAGVLWVGTWGGGLARFDRERGTFAREANRFLSSPFIWTIREDRSGGLWIGTWGGGLSWIEPERNGFETYRGDSARPSSLSHDNVVSVYEDREGLLWIGTGGGGVSVLDPSRKPFATLPLGLSGGGSDVRAIHEDRQGTLWIGTLGDGLYATETKAGRLRNYRSDPKDPASLSDDSISSLAEDSRGVLWVGTTKGLDEHDPAASRFRRHAHVSTDSRSLSDDMVTSLLAEPDTGNLWVGTSKGLNLFDPRTATSTPLPSEFNRDDGSLILERDREGALWLSRLPGLERFDPTTGVSRQYELRLGEGSGEIVVAAAHEDESGRLWLGTAIGLLSLDPATGSFTRFNQDTEAPQGMVMSILEDDEGRLWLSASQGLYRFEPGANEFKHYGPEEIGLRQGFSLGAMKSRAGRLYFGSADGLVWFDPSAIKDDDYVPPVVLTNLQLANRPVPIGSESVLRQSITETTKVELLPRDRVISLEFAALSYRAPWKNRYRYRLDGFDADWTEVDSGRRLVTYTNLPPGHYVFRVAGSNNDGFWNEDGAALAIAVLPSWWQTWWFRLGSLVGAGLVVFGAHRLRMRSLETRALALGKEIDARKKIEAVLREREEMNRGVLESLESAIALLDGEGRLTAVNESWKALFPQSVVGSNYLELRQGEELVAGIQSVLRGRREPWEAEVLRGTASGERWYSVSIVPFRGPTAGAVVSFTDIEARKRAEEEVSRHREELAHVGRISTMGELVASIAHEINQPLASIVTNANAGRRFLDREDPDRGEVRGVLAAISEQGQRASDIIRGLRKLAKKGAIEQKTLDVNELVRDVTTLVRNAAVTQRVSMRLSLADGLPRVLGDPIQLQQVLLNLLVNSFDAMSQDGTGPRDLTLRTWSDETSSVEVAVSDSGPPVPEEALRNLFTRFYTTKSTGLGIGLSTSKSIVEAHGGKLWAEPNPDRGLTLRVRLPAEVLT